MSRGQTLPKWRILLSSLVSEGVSVLGSLLGVSRDWGSVIPEHVIRFPRASQVTLVVKNQVANAGDVRSLGWEDPLEENMATHSDICAWRIPMDREAWWATTHVHACPASSLEAPFQGRDRPCSPGPGRRAVPGLLCCNPRVECRTEGQRAF